jgi:hypothetical protein
LSRINVMIFSFLISLTTSKITSKTRNATNPISAARSQSTMIICFMKREMNNPSMSPRPPKMMKLMSSGDSDLSFVSIALSSLVRRFVWSGQNPLLLQLLHNILAQRKHLKGESNRAPCIATDVACKGTRFWKYNTYRMSVEICEKMPLLGKKDLVNLQ